NSAYWRVRFENSKTISSGANRVMVCYKAAATSAEPTNKFRSSLNNRPESALLGVMYIADRDDVYAGFNFVVKNTSDPYYANTGLKDGDILGTNLVGFEWDAVNPNASPSGLVVLGQSTTTQTLSASDLEGFPSSSNPQISNAVRYTAASGAKVFATGSIQWVWGLDSDNVTSPREDIRAKQIAVNVLASMGAKPLTPGANIVVPS
ncbi:MAG: Ig domain-containing protein group 1 domain-containing protein, partial [Stigonema ocellatum SAG 48.90 = DSM 106950]|nr:Ig domain-containing protein group 1 domain-containing protein [Stigonema ocellatum SAG 48.90 = DSM 106950]